jgi:outer membrane protein OmpA-like peptidoglycan-associated protein
MVGMMKKYSKTVSVLWSALCLVLFSLSATAQQVATEPKPPGVEAPLGDVFKVPGHLVKTQTRLFFYRQADEPGIGAASLFINGTYQASLQRGGYTSICLKQAKVEVAARMVQNGQAYREDLDVINTLMLPLGQDIMVRVHDLPNGKTVMTQTPPQAALPELVKTRLQQHTISRVPGAVACEEEPKRENKAITLGADALFKFGKSDIESINPKGKKILDKLIAQIKTDVSNPSEVKLHIVGHTDAFGSEQGNLKLSKNRAEAIKDYFVKGGLRDKGITTEGKGYSELVVKDCNKKLSAESIKCNEPNRRVVVNVTFAEPANTSK